MAFVAFVRRARRCGWWRMLVSRGLFLCRPRFRLRRRYGGLLWLASAMLMLAMARMGSVLRFG